MSKKRQAKEHQIQVLLYKGSGWVDFGPTTQLGRKAMIHYAALVMKESKPYMVRVVARPIQSDWKQVKLIVRKP